MHFLGFVKCPFHRFPCRSSGHGLVALVELIALPAALTLVVREVQHEKSSTAKTWVGSPIYMAPEIVFGGKSYDAKVTPRGA